MQTVLVLGATSAVAKSLARRYLCRGAKLYFIARNQEKLAALLVEFGQHVLGSESVDFTDLQASAQAIGRAYQRWGWFDVVVIAHGYLGDQAKSETDIKEALQQITVNFSSAVAQLIALDQELERQPMRKARLAVITSVAGERGRPRNYTYGAAKAGLTIYLQGLRSRRWGRTIVTTIKLGPVDTPMTVDHEKNGLFISSDEAAAQIQRAIDQGKGEVYVPRRFWWIMRVVKCLPEPVFQRIKALSDP